MNAQIQTAKRGTGHDTPLFASTWVALFLLIRRAWQAPRKDMEL